MTNQKDSLQSDETSMSKSFRTVRILLLCHHFKAAVFVASCVAILHCCQLLDGLDIATFQLAVPQLFKASGLPDNSSNKFGSAKVITINDKLYETRFKQSSPLDRHELHDIFKKILENKPKVLAVDLDLSPGPEEITVEETELYNLLKQNNNTEIVLITPVKVYSDDLIAKKVQWMEEMSEEKHIRFGLPYLYSVKGVVLKHLSDSRSFAYQICRVAVKRGSVPNKNGESDSLKVTTPFCCDEDKQINRFKRFVSAKASTGVSNKDLEEINYKFLDSVKPIRFKVDGELEEDDKKKLTDKVVFLGGSYGPTDKYETPVGTLAGVFLHAASYYSVANPVKPFGHLAGYIMEIVVGMVFGNIFHFLLRWYRRKRSLLSIIGNLVFPLLPMYLFILAAGLLLRINYWISPAPLIVGMAIDALLNVSMGETCSETKDENKLPCIHHEIIKWVFGYGTSINEINDKNKPCKETKDDGKPVCFLERNIEKIIDYVTSNIDRISCFKNKYLRINIKCCLCYVIVIGSWVCIAEGFFKH